MSLAASVSLCCQGAEAPVPVAGGTAPALGQDLGGQAGKGETRGAVFSRRMRVLVPGLGPGAPLASPGPLPGSPLCVGGVFQAWLELASWLCCLGPLPQKHIGRRPIRTRAPLVLRMGGRLPSQSPCQGPQCGPSPPLPGIQNGDPCRAGAEADPPRPALPCPVCWLCGRPSANWLFPQIRAGISPLSLEVISPWPPPLGE